MSQESTTAQRGYHVPARRTLELINDITKLFGGEGKVQATITATPGTAAEGAKFVPVNVAAESTITLDSTPQQGQEVWVLDASAAADTNNIIIKPGGADTLAVAATSSGAISLDHTTPPANFRDLIPSQYYPVLTIVSAYDGVHVEGAPYAQNTDYVLYHDTTNGNYYIDWSLGHAAGAGHFPAGAYSLKITYTKLAIDCNSGFVHLQYIGTSWYRLPSKTASNGAIA